MAQFVLKINTESFVTRPELSTGIRVARHRRYLVIFTYQSGRIEIICVLYDSRDLSALFG